MSLTNQRLITELQTHGLKVINPQTSHVNRQQALAQLLDLHVATTASSNPVDVLSTDRHTVKPWFQGKLPYAFNLPEFQDTPFKLIGGKLVYFRHTAGAQLLVELRKHQI